VWGQERASRDLLSQSSRFDDGASWDLSGWCRL